MPNRCLFHNQTSCTAKFWKHSPFQSCLCNSLGLSCIFLENGEENLAEDGVLTENVWCPLGGASSTDSKFGVELISNIRFELSIPSQVPSPFTRCLVRLVQLDLNQSQGYLAIAISCGRAYGSLCMVCCKTESPNIMYSIYFQWC